MGIFRLAVYLIVGYIVGIFLAGPGIFSWTISATAWGNITVYMYLLFWPFILIFFFFFWAIILFVVIVVGLFFLEKLTIIVMAVWNKISK